MWSRLDNATKLPTTFPNDRYMYPAPTFSMSDFIEKVGAGYYLLRTYGSFSDSMFFFALDICNRYNLVGDLGMIHGRTSWIPTPK